MTRHFLTIVRPDGTEELVGRSIPSAQDIADETWADYDRPERLARYARIACGACVVAGITAVATAVATYALVAP